MRRVFLDTVGIIALIEVADQWHRDAEAAMRNVTESASLLVSSAHVLMECANAVARKPYRKDVCDLRKSLLTGGALLVPTSAEEQVAWEKYEKGLAANAGLVDYISFVLMERLGITEAFTNDVHFKAAGFVTLF